RARCLRLRRHTLRCGGGGRARRAEPARPPAPRLTARISSRAPFSSPPPNGLTMARPRIGSPAGFLVSRRRARSSTVLALSAGALALLGGRDALAAGAQVAAAQTEADVRILNAALGAELEAIAAYQVRAESGLLGKAVRPVALQFQGHHKEHADALSAT